MDRPAAQRPLADAADDLRRLHEYESLDELQAALLAVAVAVERSLRIRLRNDPAAPDDHRLTALSADQLPLDAVIASLRERDVISIQAAGGVHEVQAAAARAAEGAARPADADAVLAAVDRLLQELGGEPAATPGPPETGETQQAAAPAAGPPSRVGGRGRWLAWLGVLLATGLVVGLAWVALRGENRDLEAARVAFRAGRLDSAAAGFARVLEDRPQDVTTMLYLARSYRRMGRPEDAAEVLRRAVAVDGRDPDVRRELGHLFLELGSVRSAITQYERALEYDPDNPLNWRGLIVALRRADDPRAERLLRDAPADVREALTEQESP